ncbi:MAG TPA: aminotransferase class V-fold PLP-dependent enzyme, partial [Stellaceae bacterium]|nr:aminotransferase class V-fold PLP-dependent enzyme [Stellaceae bacterium]
MPHRRFRVPWRRNSGAVPNAMRATYLDWNATAPVRPEATAAVVAALSALGNPSSVHRAGRAARRLLAEARATVAALVGAQPDAIVFTSGGTEANALALQAFPGRRPIVSALEHDSVLAAAPDAAVIPARADGRVDLAALDARLGDDTRPALVSVMLANNETGVIQDVAAAAAIAHRRGALLHCDAIQVAGKIAVDIAALDVDLMSLSAHKLGGPMGVGALVVRHALPLQPLLRGGGQERRLRAGTENLPGIAGFGAAASAAA